MGHLLRGEQGADLTEKAPGTEGGEAGLSVYECREGKENPTPRPQTSCTKPAAHPEFWRFFFFFGKGKNFQVSRYCSEKFSWALRLQHDPSCVYRTGNNTSLEPRAEAGAASWAARSCSRWAHGGQGSEGSPHWFLKQYAAGPRPWWCPKSWQRDRQLSPVEPQESSHQGFRETPGPAPRPQAHLWHSTEHEGAWSSSLGW